MMIGELVFIPKTVLVVWLMFLNSSMQCLVTPESRYYEIEKQESGIDIYEAHRNCLKAKHRILRAWVGREWIELKKLECE